MELKDTIKMMIDSDYEERFRAEYHQLMIRYGKLYTMLHNWKIGILDFTPACPIELYERQLKTMEEYINILVERANIENIQLNKGVNHDYRNII